MKGTWKNFRCHDCDLDFAMEYEQYSEGITIQCPICIGWECVETKETVIVVQVEVD